jgi:hypothetical protein
MITTNEKDHFQITFDPFLLPPTTIPLSSPGGESRREEALYYPSRIERGRSKTFNFSGTNN